jgi:hypothetical protein
MIKVLSLPEASVREKAGKGLKGDAIESLG